MSDVKLFRIAADGAASELPSSGVALEKSLQNLIEHNLEQFLGVRFLASEHSTGKVHGGRIDTLGIDENNLPVIIEYKRATNENVVNQGLFYLDWLMDHQGDFQLLVQENLGQEIANALVWSAPRLICIAGEFTKFDEHAVKQMGRNIELIRYRRYGDELLLLELVNATSATDKPSSPRQIFGETREVHGKARTYKTISVDLEEADKELLDLYESLKAHLEALGDDVQTKTLQYYIAFKRIKNFACVEFRNQKGHLLVFVKVDPDADEVVDLMVNEGFLRDVRGIGHYGTGDLEITIRNQKDLERAKPLLAQSYNSA